MFASSSLRSNLRQKRCLEFCFCEQTPALIRGHSPIKCHFFSLWVLLLDFLTPCGSSLCAVQFVATILSRLTSEMEKHRRWDTGRHRDVPQLRTTMRQMLTMDGTANMSVKMICCSILDSHPETAQLDCI